MLRLKTVSYTHLDVYKRQALPQGQDLITDINTAMSITDNKAHLKVSFVYNRKGLYQAYQSRVTELKGQYGEEFSDVFDSYSSVSYTHLDVYKRQFPSRC